MASILAVLVGGGSAVARAQQPLLLSDAERATCGWRQGQQDASVLGDALRLGELEAEAGIGTHAPAELVWRVPAGQRWFSAWFGVAHVDGLRARGNVEVRKLVWREGKLVQAELRNHGREARTIRLRTAAPVVVRRGRAVLDTQAAATGVITFAAEPGEWLEVLAVGK
jgi:NPCBM/NEW2 domain